VTVESLDWEAEELPLAWVLMEDLQLQKDLLLKTQLLLLLLLVLEQLKVKGEVSSVAVGQMLLPTAASWHQVLALLPWRQWWLQRLWGLEDQGAGKEAVVAVAVAAGAALVPLAFQRLLLCRLVTLPCLSLLL